MLLLSVEEGVAAVTIYHHVYEGIAISQDKTLSLDKTSASLTYTPGWRDAL